MSEVLPPQDFEPEEKAFFEESFSSSDSNTTRPWLAAFVALFSPGASALFTNRFYLGLTTNLSFSIALFLFFILWGVLDFFPFFPFLCLLLLFLGITLWCAIAAYHRELHKKNAPSLWRSPLVLFSFSLLTFWIPLLLALFCSVKWIFQETWSENDAMKPNIMSGDVVLVDRSEFLFRDPNHGELVLVEDPNIEASSFYARIIAIPGDSIQLDGVRPVVNNKKLQQFLPKPDSVQYKIAEFAIELPAFPLFTEESTLPLPEPSHWYSVLSPEQLLFSKTNTLVLEDNMYFVLEDNRSAAIHYENEGQFGRIIHRTWVKGQPKFIAYNRHAPNLQERFALKLR